MLLCIDIGNTNIKLGLFEGEAICCHWRISTDPARLADEYAMLLLDLLSAENLRPSSVTGCAISSVVPALTQVFSELAQRYFKQDPLVVRSGSNTGIMEIHTDLPSEVGPDLVINAVAARHLYGAPVIVIGFGTATTFVAVSKAGHLEGVAIAPGIITSGNSLFHATATLPQVALTRPPVAVGKNTITSLQAGMIFGFAGLVEGLVERMQAELGAGETGKPAQVVATGGLANVIAPETRSIQHIEPNLGLIGLRLTYAQTQQPR
ncbi:MAG: type III pantothenate kinase [Chloroflexi bacterium]|nr:MAG: type III pantothenate kinase [Chloroflexota bacterium]